MNQWDEQKEVRALTAEEFQAYCQKQSYNLRDKIRDYLRNNHFSAFLTLTFNPELIDSTDFEAVQKVLREWLKKMKRRNPDFQYLAVPELHKKVRENGKRGIHWHIVVDKLPARWKRKIDKKTGRKVYHHGLAVHKIPDWSWGYSDVTKIDDKIKTSNYVVKYITKELYDPAMGVPKGSHHFLKSKGLEQAETLYLNLTVEEIQKIERNSDQTTNWDNKKFVDMETGEILKISELVELLKAGQKEQLEIIEATVQIFDHVKIELHKIFSAGLEKARDESRKLMRNGEKQRWALT